MAAVGQIVMDALVGSCEETRGQLSAHLDGDLRGLRRWRVSMHLWRCDRCRALLESLARTVERIRELGADTVTAGMPSVADSVIERIRRK